MRFPGRGGGVLRTKVRYQAGQIHRNWVEDVPMGNIPPRIIGKVEHNQDEVVQMILALYSRTSGDTTIGIQITSGIPSTTDGYSTCERKET